MRAVQSDLILRPDRRKALTTLIVVAVITVGIVSSILGGDAPGVFAPIVGGVFAVLIALIVMSLVRGRITLTAQEITVRGLTTQRRPRARVTEAVRATITAPRGGSTDSLFLLDAQRNLVIRVNGTNYTREQFDELVKVLGVPCSGPGSPVSPNQLAKTYPGMLSGIERHPYRVGFAIAACVMVITLVVIGIALAS